MSFDAKIPQGDLANKWSKHKFDLKLVNPSNKKKYTVIGWFKWGVKWDI